jgi:hypothetical protein
LRQLNVDFVAILHLTRLAFIHSITSPFTYFQILVLHWMFCIVCSFVRGSNKSEDYELANSIASCIQEVHRFHAHFCSSRLRKIEHNDETFDGFAHSLIEGSIALRM